MSRRYSRRLSCCHVEQLERREMLTAGAWGAYGPSIGRTSDDFGNTFAAATELPLTSTGSANQTGKIEQALDVDMFKVVATVSGEMTIQELAASGSRLDPYLYVYDANQQLIAQDDDSGAGYNSQVTINVTAGQTYYIKAAGYGRSHDAYRIQMATTTATPDDFGNTRAAATALELSAAGTARQSGSIETAGDVDVLRFVATVTGEMTIIQSADNASRLDSYLYVYDADGQLLAQNDDNGWSLNSQVELSVVAGNTYYVKAAAYWRSTGNYTLELTTVASDPDSGTTSDPDGGTTTDPEGGTTTDPGTSTPTTDGTGFQIDVTMTGFTAAQQAIVQQAIDIWESIIVGDLPDVTYQGRTIDDLSITISSITIDGSGNVLGQSSATAFRSDSRLPYLGFIQLDTSDVASMESSGSLLGVLTHEIAHVLGFGVIWSDLGLLTVSGTRTRTAGFTGANAVAEYNALFGTNVTAVPVETDGGSGTALAHWDETVFDNELMTGWYNSGETNPISRITVASFADLGYEVNMNAAQSYTPSTTAVTAASASSVASSYNYGGYYGGTSDPWGHGRRHSYIQAVDQVMASY
jgi:hypothetical protein